MRPCVSYRKVAIDLDLKTQILGRVSGANAWCLDPVFAPTDPLTLRTERSLRDEVQRQPLKVIKSHKNVW